MQYWEYEIIKALDDLMWCDDAPDDDDGLELEFSINFQWIAWFLANKMTRIIDYGRLFEEKLKIISIQLENDDYDPPLNVKKDISAILQIAAVKAMALARDVETRYNIPFNINYYDRIAIIDDIFYKRG